MKSGVGIKFLAGGWYKVAIMIFPVCVVTSIASKSDKKLSISLCTIFFLTAIAVPSAGLLSVFFCVYCIQLFSWWSHRAYSGYLLR